MKTLPPNIESQSHLYAYWGKTRRSETEEWSWHLLPYHCFDVAAVADSWWRLDAPMRRSLIRVCGTNESRTRAWLLFFCAMHDFGKWDIRFQLKAPEVAKSLQPDLEANPAKYDHGRGGFAAFVKESGRHDENAVDWMRSVAGHHGSFPLDAEWRAPAAASPRMRDADRRARKDWLDALEVLFLKPAGESLTSEVPSHPPQLAGFCCVADWLGSNEAFFPYEGKRRDFADYFRDRIENAERCLKDNGLLRTPCATGGMVRVFPKRIPRSIQTLVEQWPLGPGLTLIEAPTGSGKTEAALAYASRLLAEGSAGSVIFALPTQATANAMLPRIEAVSSRLFECGTNLVLAHGRSRYNKDFMRLQAGSSSSHLEQDATAQCSRWLAASRKKVFLGQIGVCTVDQVLLSVLPIRHHFVRGFGIHKSVLIVDEIHAYDGYMNGLLDEVLKRQRDAGGSAILLSATLNANRRRTLLNLWDQTEQPGSSSEDDPYPLVSRADETGRRYWTASTPEPPRRVRIETLHSPGMKVPEEALGRILRAAEGGARVVLICNLVAEAQEAARRLSASGTPVDLFHSRFRFCDRQELEDCVLKSYGKESPRTAGRILVATQVVEQSLDLDFDWMVTQLCPVDLLFQRLGRLHRHDGERPEDFREPRCLVVGPASLDFGGHKYIYANARALWRTQQLIERRTEAVFPEAYREWIEAVYAENAWTDEPAEIVRLFEKFEADADAKRLCARSLLNSGMMELSDTDGNVGALTRDGEMAASVIPLLNTGSARCFLDGSAFLPGEEGFDEQADRNSVPVPRWWAEDLPSDEGDKSGRRLLYLEAFSKNRWEGVAGGARWSYDRRFGLERRKT